jgi:uncharacterized protein (DUF2147 family)
MDSMMTLLLRNGAALSLLTVFSMTDAKAADPIGTWLTDGQLAHVRIAKCANALCGRIVGLRDPIDPATGRPLTDTGNPNAAKRSRPLMGLQVMVGMRRVGTDQWTGQLYNADDGKTYTGTLVLTGADSLKVEGCVPGSQMCGAQTWTRAK